MDIDNVLFGKSSDNTYNTYPLGSAQTASHVLGLDTCAHSHMISHALLTASLRGLHHEGLGG